MNRRDFLKKLAVAPAAVIVPGAMGSLIHVEQPPVRLEPLPIESASEELIDQILSASRLLDEQMLPDDYFMLTRKASRDEISKMYRSFIDE